jgi:hypothetical protein
MERLIQHRYQLCLIDLEGDYESMAGCVTISDERHIPSLDQVGLLLDKVDTQLVVNLVAVALAESRWVFCRSLLTSLQERRLHTGRPHWIL